MNKKQAITEKQVLNALSAVMDPELGSDLVTLNMIRDLKIEGANVSLSIALTSSACPLKKELTEAAKAAVSAIPGINRVAVVTTVDAGQERTCGEGKKGTLPTRLPLPGITHTIAVASGKGGVGKSTVTVNLALALAAGGARVGILDIDIYGPSIPTMMGFHEPIAATTDEKLIPHESHGIKLMSIGFMVDDETPLIWRGPIVMQLVQQFLRDVIWGELDYLIIDLPPGTGDAQLTLVQTIPLSGIVVVTTPQDVALMDARRAISMFSELKVPILGIIENMSYFKCPSCGERSDIFSHGGGQKTSERYKVPLLGEIPIDQHIRESSDAGKPIVIDKPESPQAVTFIEIARTLDARLNVAEPA